MRAVSLLACVVALAAHAAVSAKLDSVGEPQILRYHWRVRPVSAGELRCGVVWNYTDSTNYDEAALRVADTRHADAFGRESAELQLRRVREGNATIAASRTFAPAEAVGEAGISMLIELEEGAARPVLSVGSRSAEVEMPVELLPHTMAGGYASTPVDTLVCRMHTVQLPKAEFAPFGSVAELMSYLAASSDAGECVWQYHDRDTDPLRVSLGGDYRLATVRHPDGGYMLVYLAGCPSWQPLRLKGRLVPTGFIGEFDLEWLDVDGASMGADCSALMTDASLLTFRFPLYDATLRFRRVPKSL